MFVLSSVLFILVLIPSGFPFILREAQYDKQCPVTGGVLCLKDELEIIIAASKNIEHALKKLNQMLERTNAFEPVVKYINQDMNYTRSNLPFSLYHEEFSRLNNINQKFLADLFLEAYNALVFFDNSIDDLMEPKVEYVVDIDDAFKSIQQSIRYDIICRYRLALSVFSRPWLPSSELSRIQFSTHQTLAPSVAHHVHSVVILRYLQQWMKQIHYVITNLENKFH